MKAAFLLLASVAAEVLQLIYHINDGVEANSYIGNIPQDAQHVKPNHSSHLFSVVKGKEFVTVEPRTGDLRTASKIDREKVCTGSLTSSRCTVTAEVIITPREFFKLFQVELIIDDLNDNVPQFPAPEITIHLAENVALGTEIRLDSAVDADSDVHGIERYYLGDEDKLVPNDYFRLVEEHIDEVIIPVLRVTKPIDYERQKNHELRLNAIDRGGLVGSTLIHIVVDDANDNSPIFPREKYKVQITESMPVGEIILHLAATDADSGLNGALLYSYNSLVNSKTASMFPLNETTGEIRVGESIDFEAARSHILYVQAADQGQNPSKAYCTVIVEIIDTNDNAPTVEVSFIDTDDGAELVIPEDVQIGSFVAFVSITDADLGPAGEIEAYLEGGEESDSDCDFELEVVDQVSHRYIIKTARELDRERVAEYTLTLVARDHGVPPLETIHYVSVSVGDINDNAPYFGHETYFLRVQENNEPGQELATVMAQDLDDGDNARISYSLVSQSDYVSLNGETGQLILTKVIDAEHTSSPMRVIIEATDAGVPPKSGQTELVIEIVDVNDNAPQFARDGYHFRIEENQPTGTVVGSVLARDPDAASTVHYSLTGEHAHFLDIDSTSGSLLTATVFDFETMPAMMEVDVTATDSGGLSSTVFVVVEVIDINDNAPELTFPPMRRPVIQIHDKHFNDFEKDAKTGKKVIAQLRATDHDAHDVVTFELRSSVRKIDVSPTGEVIVTEQFDDSDEKLILVPLKLSDGAVDQLVTECEIFIYRHDGAVNETALNEAMEQARFEANSAAFALVDGKNTLLLALFAGIILICVLATMALCVHCRHRRNKPNNVPPLLNRNQRGDETLDWSHELEWKQFDHSKRPILKNEVDAVVDVDSGAGDSISDSSQSYHKTYAVAHGSPLSIPSSGRSLAKAKRLNAQPSFSTFKDDDASSVQIYDEERYHTDYARIYND